MLGSIVSETQTAFVPGRQLLDRVLIANEMLDYVKKSTQSFLLFKVDFEKAYDRVSWDYLIFIMRRMGFGNRWMNWMNATVFSSWMSILVNRSATMDFKVGRGLCQGDPLSPFLFVLEAEGLSDIVKKNVSEGEFQGIKVGTDCEVDILQFADDTLLLGPASWRQIWVLKSMLRAFEVISGLGVNYNKCRLIGINLFDCFLEVAAYFLSCRIEKSSFNFLGIPFGFNSGLCTMWKPLIQKIKLSLIIGRINI